MNNIESKTAVHCILQVQFRLKQIISADSQHKESLLRELEEFAFQGCTKSMTYDTAAAGENVRVTVCGVQGRM